MNKMKKWMAAVLAVMMALLCLSACTDPGKTASETPSEAQSGEPSVESSAESIEEDGYPIEGDYVYELIDNGAHVRVLNYNGTAAEVEIPSVVAGKPVTEIGYFKNQLAGDSVLWKNETVTSVIIPEGVTRINGCAIYGCTALTEVTLPASVIVIDHHAFYGCDNLQTVHYGGEADHSGLTIVEGNEPLKNATWEYEYTP